MVFSIKYYISIVFKKKLNHEKISLYIKKDFLSLKKTGH